MRQHAVYLLEAYLQDVQGIRGQRFFASTMEVVVEVLSPGDESYDKLDFYARLQIPEVWMVDRDTKVPEILVVDGGVYSRQSAECDGWVRSRATSISLRATERQKLTMRLGDDDASSEDLPPDFG